MPDFGTGQELSHSVSGWSALRAFCESLFRRGSFSSIPGGGDIGALPEGAGGIAAGAVLMAFAPVVYVAGLLLAGPMAWRAYRREGQGSFWPFLAITLGLFLWVAGWQMIANTEMVSDALELAQQAGVDAGVSGWAYLMLLGMIPMSLVAKGKPDYDLAEIARYKEDEFMAA